MGVCTCTCIAYGGLCVPGAPGPNGGAWVPYSLPLVELLGQVTCGSLRHRLCP